MPRVKIKCDEEKLKSNTTDHIVNHDVIRVDYENLDNQRVELEMKKIQN